MHFSPVVVCTLLIIALLLACAGPSLAATAAPDTARPLAPSEIERREIGDKMDKAGMRYRKTATDISSDEVLRIPEQLKDVAGFTVAKTAPKIDWLILQVEPRYFLQPPHEKDPVPLWSSWGQGAYNPTTGRFYAAFGNHVFYDAQVHIMEYDPESGAAKISPNVNELMGRSATDFGDGKIHGWMDFYKRNTLYFLTYWCAYPYPSEEQFATGYEGGTLASYNVETGEFHDYGVPIRRTSYPYHRVDTKRGILYGVGVAHEFLAYDIEHKRILWAGMLPDGMKWYDRCMIVDEDTGYVYSSNLSKYDPDVHFIRYDPARNRFTRMESCVPRHSMAGENLQMRGHTRAKAADGWFMGVTRGGALFKFYPDEDKLEDMGLCWPGDPTRLYTTSMAKSPDDKYVYFIPGAHGQSHYNGTPVVQVNAKTGERKAIAFLFPYMYDHYGYIPGGTFSLDIDDKGERLFVLFNGAFREFDPKGGDVFGDLSVMVIHVPESERR